MDLRLMVIFVLVVLWKDSTDAETATTQLQKTRCASTSHTSVHPEYPEEQTQDSSVLSKRDFSLCKQKYVISVIWHVITDSQNNGHVSNKMLQDQIDVLNDAFENTTLLFRMEFIERVANDTWAEDCFSYKEDIRRTLGKLTDSNLNLYVCNMSMSTAIGDASYPWDYAEDSLYNGVMIHTETLPGGTLYPFDQGDNLVHEVGHYFGLYHTFEGGCSDHGDLVTDTAAAAYPTFGCPLDNVDTCPKRSGPDPIHNYMSYTQDSCMNHFTTGQVKRMEWIIDTYRTNLRNVAYRPCNIDSVFRWSDGYIYLFAGSSHYRYNEISRAIDPEFPRPIHEHWRGVPDNIDGVFRYANGITYFFKGKYYYRFNDATLQVDTGYPKKMELFWKGIPDNIDDVIRYSNGHTYFFKDSLYYRFNSTTATVDAGYPKPMKKYWIGIPSNIDGAFTWYNGGVYFFKDSSFWFYMPGPQRLVHHSYPKLVTDWWSVEQQTKHFNAFRYFNGYTYFMSNQEYWRFNDFKKHVDYTYPHPASNWRGLPSHVDAIFLWSDGRLYAFKSNSYYRFNNNMQAVDTGYPKEISTFWKGVPNDIDAAFRSNDGDTYFFKGSSYYLLNDTDYQVATGYPKSISSFWKGVPNNIDTVVSWSNGQTYFFKGNDYYRFNYAKGAVDDGYPRPFSGAWKGMVNDQL